MNTKIFKISTFAIIAILAFACKKYDVIPPNSKTPIQPTHTIEQLINEFGTQNGVMFPVRPNSGTAGLYSVDTIRKGGDDIIIVGRVISDDSYGNIYKYITIQDLQNPKWNIKISIDASGIGALYHLGEVISVRCNGLAIGKYADMFQLGTVYYNNADPVLTLTTDIKDLKEGYEPGRMPLPLFKVRAEIYGMPDISKIVADTLTIAQINQAATDRSLHSRLVCIKNAYFNQKSQGKDITADADKIFAPSTNGIGYPQSRDITDGTSTVSVATSEYANFCNVRIPTEEYVGTVTAIVGWYRDKAAYGGSVQLTIRSLNDLQLYSIYDGSKWKP